MDYSYAACFHARLGEGDAALDDLTTLARTSTLPNLLTWFYPLDYRLFQIEAGFGATAAMAEMLLQSHRGCIRLLPGLPARWANGHFKGLKARGAFVVDAAWKEGKITQASIKSLKGTPCKVLNGRPWHSVEVTCQRKVVASRCNYLGDIITFDPEPSKTYTLGFD